MDLDRRAFISSLGGTAAVALMSPEQKADALEHYMEEELDAVIEAREMQSGQYPTVAEIAERNANLDRPYRRGVGRMFVARDGKLRKLENMPEKPTVLDFFKYRFAPANHVLQSATRALKTGMREEIVLACLLHDVVNNMMRPDHGWWGAQLVEPYVPEITSFAIRYHQVLRFYPDGGVRVRVPGELSPLIRRGLQAGAVSAARVPVRAQPQVVRASAAGDGERPLRVRPQRDRIGRAVHRHHRTPLQAAERRTRLGQQCFVPHVADDHQPRPGAVSPAFPRRRARQACAASHSRPRVFLFCFPSRRPSPVSRLLPPDISRGARTIISIPCHLHAAADRRPVGGLTVAPA